VYICRLSYLVAPIDQRPHIDAAVFVAAGERTRQRVDRDFENRSSRFHLDFPDELNELSGMRIVVQQVDALRRHVWRVIIAAVLLFACRDALKYSSAVFCSDVDHRALLDLMASPTPPHGDVEVLA